MRFPEFLYHLNPTDEGKQLLIPGLYEASGNDSAVTVGTTVFQVPADQALILSAACLVAVPGGAQTITDAFIAIADEDATRQWPLARGAIPMFTGLAIGAINWSGEVVVPPRFRIRVQASYSAGAVTNTTSGNAFGVLVPRGSMVFDIRHP